MSEYDVIAGDYHSAERGLTNRFSGQKETTSLIVKETGAIELWKPAAGKRITLYWIAMNTPEANTLEVKAVVKLGVLEPYAWYLGKPGAFMHWEPILGATDAKLEIETSNSQTIAVSFTLTEDYPRPNE